MYNFCHAWLKEFSKFLRRESVASMYYYELHRPLWEKKSSALPDGLQEEKHVVLHIRFQNAFGGAHTAAKAALVPICYVVEVSQKL